MEGEEAADILLVEDDPYDAELTARVLRKRNLASRPFIVGDGADALDFVYRRGKYASTPQAIRMIVLDLDLPGVHGLEVLRTLKGDERTRTIPVVILTSSGEARDQKAAYELGANGYVVKPSDFETFSEAVGGIGLY